MGQTAEGGASVRLDMPEGRKSKSESLRGVQLSQWLPVRGAELGMLPVPDFDHIRVAVCLSIHSQCFEIRVRVRSVCGACT